MSVSNNTTENNSNEINILLGRIKIGASQQGGSSLISEITHLLSEHKGVQTNMKNPTAELVGGATKKKRIVKTRRTKSKSIKQKGGNNLQGGIKLGTVANVATNLAQLHPGIRSAAKLGKIPSTVGKASNSTAKMAAKVEKIAAKAKNASKTAARIGKIATKVENASNSTAKMAAKLGKIVSKVGNASNMRSKK